MRLKFFSFFLPSKYCKLGDFESMSIEILVEKKLEEEFNTEMLEIKAETTFPGTEISFFLDGNHLATTMTDGDGVAIAGITYEEDKTYLFEVECGGERTGLEYEVEN